MLFFFLFFFLLVFFFFFFFSTDDLLMCPSHKNHSQQTKTHKSIEEYRQHTRGLLNMILTISRRKKIYLCNKMLYFIFGDEISVNSSEMKLMPVHQWSDTTIIHMWLVSLMFSLFNFWIWASFVCTFTIELYNVGAGSLSKNERNILAF